MEGQRFISVERCSVWAKEQEVIQSFSWNLQEGQVWLITGPSGGGKEYFIQALANQKERLGLPVFRPQPTSVDSYVGGQYFNKFSATTQLVSLETAAALIQEERDRDEGDFIEGGIDIGRTAARFICEVLPEPVEVSILQQLPQVQLCGVASVLNRGVKYLSTGEVRRVLLCRSLLSSCQLLILSEPFAGLDVQSRGILKNFFSERMESRQAPIIMLSMEALDLERFQEVPSGITHVAEFAEGRLSFQGELHDYKNLLSSRVPEGEGMEKQRRQTESTFQELHSQQTHFSTGLATGEPADGERQPEVLVDMQDVRVAWGDKVVLNKLNWQVRAGEHWLVRGPNGSGKTTLLELITGDNMQVFCNNVSIFGRRRGTGETIWELKEKMGIVSYRLHLEYRMVGGTDIEAVLLSGFHDSIGLYQQRSQVEQMAVERWLEIGGFQGRGHEAFSSLSYGEQRAILILRAAVKCPPLLILDEPCHGLDGNQRSRILHLLETIAATGTTTLLHVTHDVTEVLSCEQHILELESRLSPADDEKPCYRIITGG
ncbi:MAG: ATP-binding cassette domain-containing protein [Treponema sp.]|nr:ATP-binding cassette domain-containing protein [Treponema sp.]